MFVRIKGQNFEGKLVIDEVLYETMTVPRIGECIMVHSNDTYYFLKVILVLHKGSRENTKDFHDENIQIYGIETNFQKDLEVGGFKFPI